MTPAAHGRLIVFLFVALAAACASPPVLAQCVPSTPMDQFIVKSGISDTIHSDSDLLQLLENPTILVADANPADDGDPAASVATTEAHVLYPIQLEDFLSIVLDTETLTQIVPDIAVYETLCESGSGVVKQFQRTEFNILFFTFGTEYLFDLYQEGSGSDEHSIYWGVYESPDGKLAYQYGSWYFKYLTIEGRQYTYIRHFTRNGVTLRIPGLRMIMRRSAGERVSVMLDAIYSEAVDRYGNTPVP